MGSLTTGRVREVTSARELDPFGRTRFLFGWTGLITGSIAALATMRWTGSWAAAVFVGILVVYVLARAVCDLVTDNRKLSRALYFAILPCVAVAVMISVTMVSSTEMAGLLGLVIGWLTQQAVGGWLLPRIQADEHADDLAHFHHVLSS